MVKGLVLRNPPEMDKYMEVDILAELDVLTEVPNDTEGKIKEYEGTKFHTIITEYPTKESIDSVMTILSTLEDAVPELIKVFLWDDSKVVFSFPVLKDHPKDSNIYQLIVNELLRVTTFLISESNTELSINNLSVQDKIRKYVSLFIKW